MTRGAGFTLIEVLIAAAVLGVVLLGASALSIAASVRRHRSGDHTTAAELGQQHLEWLRNQGYASSDLTAGATTATLGGDYSGYVRTTIVQDATPRTGVKEITVVMLAPSGVSARATALLTE